jgi:hypothetical protein
LATGELRIVGLDRNGKEQFAFIADHKNSGSGNQEHLVSENEGSEEMSFVYDEREFKQMIEDNSESFLIASRLL